MAMSQCRVFVGDSAAEDFLGKVAAGFEAEWTGLDDPVIGHGLDAGDDVFAAALAFDHEVGKGRIRALEHATSIGEEVANIFCGFLLGTGKRPFALSVIKRQAFLVMASPTQANRRLEWATRPMVVRMTRRFMEKRSQLQDAVLEASEDGED